MHSWKPIRQDCVTLNNLYTLTDTRSEHCRNIPLLLCIDFLFITGSCSNVVIWGNYGIMNLNIQFMPHCTFILGFPSNCFTCDYLNLLCTTVHHNTESNTEII